LGNNSFILRIKIGNQTFILDFHQPFICSAASSGRVKSEGPPADEALLDKVTEKDREKELGYM
jgi:hypothetical protein